MLSKKSFQIGFVLSTGAMTLHDLGRTLVFQGMSLDQRVEMLLEGLAELCKGDFIDWWLEPDYGNVPSVSPPDFGEQTFLKWRQDFIKKLDLSVEVPDRQNPTLFIEGTAKLDEEIDKTCYDEWRQEIRW